MVGALSGVSLGPSCKVRSAVLGEMPQSSVGVLNFLLGPSLLFLDLDGS